MALKSMALSQDEAKKDMFDTAPGVAEAPKYPYGLCLDLNDESLKKLGITKLPAVGEEVTIMAKAKVSRISAYEEQEGAEQCVGLQITDMAVDMPSATPAGRLYAETTGDD